MGSLKRLIPYFRDYRGLIFVALLSMLLSGMLSGAILGMMERVLKPMLSSEGADRIAKLNYYTLILTGIALLRMFTDFGQTYLTQKLAQRLLARVRRDLFAHFQQLSIGFFERKRTGELLSRMTNDLSALHGIVTTAVVTAVSAPVELAIALGLMLHFNWRLSIFVFLVVPPAAFLINRAGRKIRAATLNMQEQFSVMTDYLQEKIAAMRLIQTFGTKNYEIEVFDKVNMTAYSRTMKPIRIQAALAPTIEFTGMMGVMLSLWFGGTDVIHGKMEPGALITFLVLVHRVAMRAKSIASLNLLLKQGDAAASRLFELLDTKPEIEDAPDAIDLAVRRRDGRVKGHLRFEDVGFSYDGSHQVLHSITFDIKPGEVLALAGLSGSGKSTIAALVPRLYDPGSGRVLLDGIDLRNIQLLSLRGNIGAVPQDTTLFHGTIRENIAYGKPQASFEEIVEAATKAHADEFIQRQPKGYDTDIGERGGRLSGGQRQRIAIARALLRDPRILILDEATSSLDAESEGLVQDALATLMEGRTTLIIAHRFATIWRANRILVLDQGHIVESGTHDQLLERHGLYYRLYQMQSFATRSKENLEIEEHGGDDLDSFASAS